jgi:micrococcal nuclease
MKKTFRISSAVEANKIVRILILLALLLPSQALAAPEEVYGIVTHVVDGDTIFVQIKGYDSRIGNISVRLDDVDCPEMSTPEGSGAKRYAIQELNGSSVSLDLDDKTGKDNYCRWVAVVFLHKKDGAPANFNRMLVDSGHACIWDFTNNEFDPAAWWNGTIPSTACEKRFSSSVSCSDGPLVGNAQSRKYHYSCCEWAKKISPANETRFTSSQDARNQGYVPCKVCNPP